MGPVEHQGKAEHQHWGDGGGEIRHLDRDGDHQGDEPRDYRHSLGEGA